MRESNTALQIKEDLVNQIHISSVQEAIEEDAKLHSLPFKYEEASDEALIELYVLRGCELSFNEIVSRYGDIILGFAVKLCRNAQDAEDIKQDVLLILATKLHTFKGNSKFSTWLYRVTINTCYKYLKDSSKKSKNELNLDDQIPIELSSRSDWAKSPDEILLQKERMDIIQHAVQELNDSNQKIFGLKEINGYSNAEVGKCMGLSISAVKSRVLRTRIAIKHKISDHF